MAQYRATVRGSRSSASRLGGKTSGIDANVNGWNLGVGVSGNYNEDHDVFVVCITGGSNGGGIEKYNVIERRDDNGRLTGFTVSEKSAPALPKQKTADGKYRVKVKEVLTRIVEVEAEDEERAVEVAQMSYDDGEIIMDVTDGAKVDTIITVI